MDTLTAFNREYRSLKRRNGNRPSTATIILVIVFALLVLIAG